MRVSGSAGVLVLIIVLRILPLIKKTLMRLVSLSPEAVSPFIPEHQGTILIAYFYHQAQQHRPFGKVIQEAAFCYDGPMQQSQETGIVMLAAACEAALLSLEEATPAEMLAMVNKILKARWQEQQLVDSGLTWQELLQISHIFVPVWQQFHHKRIAYPK